MKNNALFMAICCILFMNCSKNDIDEYKKYHNEVKDGCYTESLSPEKILDTIFEPAFIKTYDESGIFTHLKMQVIGFWGELIVFDHDISYMQGKTVLKGNIKIFGRSKDCYPCTDQDPYLIRELESSRNEKDIEIVFDPNTNLPIEVFQPDDEIPAEGDIRYYSRDNIKLVYNDSRDLSKVTYEYGLDQRFLIEFNFITDQNGNIISIDQNGFTKIIYKYANKGIGKKQFYEPSEAWMVHGFYSLLEVLNWGTFQPKSERIYMSALLYEGSPAEIVFTDHKYNIQGKLISYSRSGGLNTDYTSMLNWQCKRLVPRGK